MPYVAPQAMDFATKVQRTHDFPEEFKADADTVLNRLFFSARNGAISHLLRTFEQHFADQGMRVEAQWCETSFPSPYVRLTLQDKRSGEHQRTLRMERTVARRSEALPSELVYRLLEVQVGEYCPHRIPKAVEAFDAVLAGPAFQAEAAQWINGANYPFHCPSYSSF